MSAKWRCGRKLPGRLGLVVRETQLPIRRLYANTEENYNGVFVDRRNIASVIQGKKNLKRYIEILESAWSLSIAEIREFYAADRLQEPTRQELNAFLRFWLDRRKGQVA